MRVFRILEKTRVSMRTSLALKQEASFFRAALKTFQNLIWITQDGVGSTREKVSKYKDILLTSNLYFVC